MICEQCASDDEGATVILSGIPSDEFTLNTSGEVTKKKSNTGLIIGIAIAGVAVLALLIALLLGPVSGLLGFGLKFDTPQEHFSYVEGKAVDQLTDKVTTVYGSYLAQAQKTESACEAEVHVLVGDDLLELLAAYLGTGDELDLSWLSDIMLNIDATGDTELGQAMITLGLGENAVISADMVLDMSEMMMWLAIPELSSTYIELDLETLMDGAELEYDPAYAKEMINALPSEQVVNALLEKYTEIILSNITNVEGRKETVTVDGVSQECTVLVATIDEKTMIEISIALLEAARDDEKLIEVVENLVKTYSSEEAASFAQNWKDSIDSALEDNRESLEIASTDSYVQLIDYVDKNHNIIGRHITVSDTEEEIYYLKAQDGEKFAFEADVLDSFAVEGDGTIKNDVVNAEYDVKIESVEFAAIQVVEYSEKTGGKICMIPSDAFVAEIVGVGLDMDIALELTMEKDKSGDSVALKVLMDEEMFVGITADIKQKDAAAVSKPTNTIDMMNEEELTAWIAGFNYDAVLDKLGKAGLPEELMDSIEQLLAMME